MTTYMYASNTPPSPGNSGWMEHITEIVDGKPIRYYLYKDKRWHEFKKYHEIPEHAVKMSYEEFVMEML